LRHRAAYRALRALAALEQGRVLSLLQQPSCGTLPLQARHNGIEFSECLVERLHRRIDAGRDLLKDYFFFDGALGRWPCFEDFSTLLCCEELAAQECVVALEIIKGHFFLLGFLAQVCEFADEFPDLYWCWRRTLQDAVADFRVRCAHGVDPDLVHAPRKRRAEREELARTELAQASDIFFRCEADLLGGTLHIHIENRSADELVIALRRHVLVELADPLRRRPQALPAFTPAACEVYNRSRALTLLLLRTEDVGFIEYDNDGLPEVLWHVHECFKEAFDEEDALVRLQFTHVKDRARLQLQQAFG
jgi:hypothetical protein